MNQRSSVYVGLRVFIAGVLIFNSVALGASRRGQQESSETRKVTIGVRFGNGDELYFRDCALVDAAVNNDEIISEGTDGCAGVTPLTWAVAYYPSKVSTLLDAGADPNTTQNGGATPLHLALSKGAYESVWMLLESGADSTTVTDTGMTSLHVLYQGCSSCGTNEEEATTGSQARRQIASRIISMAGQSSLNATDNFGATPLYYAAMSSTASEKISELIELGANSQIRDENGAPIWFYAELVGNSAASEQLRILAGDPVGTLDDLGRDRDKWVEVNRLKIDEIRPQMDPEAIKSVIPKPAGHLSFSHEDYGCHYWMGQACTVVGGFGCFSLCQTLSGPYKYFCGALCTLGAALGCHAAVELVCGPTP